MSDILEVTKFLAEYHSGDSLLIDTRSPAEYEHAHIPGAINIALLDNEQRAIIGTTYKQKGREAAVLKGFDLVGPKFGDFIREVKSKTNNRQVFVYCWRGGLRSNIMSWVLSMGGFRVSLLLGGYKKYRAFVLSELIKERSYIVLGGKTGSGKTEWLQAISKFCPVVDLETMANHRGSAFGHLGQRPQPSNEQFENLLAEKFYSLPVSEKVWIENESRTIGIIKIPDTVFETMRNSPTVEVLLDYRTRKERILNEYGKFPVELLAEATKKIRKRLGELRLSQALEHLVNNEMDLWVEMMLDYYDQTYSYGMTQRNQSSITTVEINPIDSVDVIAQQIIRSAAPLVNQKV